MKRIVLGVDPGTRVTGYGVVVIEDGVCRALDFGCIRPPPNIPLPARYLVIFNGIDQLIERFLPEEVAVETQFVQKNIQSAMKLGMARAAVLLAAGRRKASIHEYAPSRAKKAVVGNGGASKEQVQKMVQVLLQLPSLPEPEDAADALALALCHIQNCRVGVA
jgi:crossover junction endodeoxyribonuclease RuvC